MKKRLLSSLCLIHIFGFNLSVDAHSQKRGPAVDDLLNVKQAGGAQMSPDGRRVAYTVSEADFQQDAFVTKIWIADADSGRACQLTRGGKSAGSPQWRPSGEWLAFTSDRAGGKNQIFAIRPDGGEAVQLTKAENGLGGFVWSRDGNFPAFTATDVNANAAKDCKEHLGDFEEVRKDYNHSRNPRTVHAPRLSSWRGV